MRRKSSSPQAGSLLTSWPKSAPQAVFFFFPFFFGALSAYGSSDYAALIFQPRDLAAFFKTIIWLICAAEQKISQWGEADGLKVEHGVSGVITRRLEARRWKTWLWQ